MEELREEEMGVEYAPLPTEFDGRGSQSSFKFKQLQRNGMISIYQKTDGLYTGYEVIVIKNQKESWWGSIHYAAKERYPSDEEFGQYGWATSDHDRAIEIFNQLVTG